MAQSSSILQPVSGEAQSILTLFYLLCGISGVILLIIVGAVLYSLMRFRRRPDQGEPRPIFGNVRLELVWTILPLIIVTALFFASVGIMRAIEPPGDGQEPDLIVIGHQWWWEVRYPKTGVITANEVHLPVGQKLLVQLESADVIHSFWVPQLGRKKDLVPGHTNQLWLQADRPGTYLGACAEYCGVQHAWMRLRVIAQPPAAFAAWTQAQLQTPVTPATGEAAQGAKRFQQLTCVNCHAIAGTPAQARVAPDLTHLASRQTLAAGVLENNAANLTAWLTDPQAVKPGNHMPRFGLGSDDVQALVAYLETLQ